MTYLGRDEAFLLCFANIQLTIHYFHVFCAAKVAVCTKLCPSALSSQHSMQSRACGHMGPHASLPPASSLSSQSLAMQNLFCGEW